MRAAAFALAIAVAANVQAADTSGLAITGTIELPPELADAVAGGDRLVIRMYHPDEGIEKDLKYWILDDYAFPQAFAVAPTVNMAGKARWESYVIEAFTDRDRDVLNLVEGELWTTTGELVPVGTGNVFLTLGHPPAD